MKNGIDLHLHLDGSLTPGYLSGRRRSRGISSSLGRKGTSKIYDGAP